MTRLIPLVLVFGLTIYALIDCARTDESQIKNLPKWGWLLLIIILGPQALAIGPVAYLVAGRNKPKWTSSNNPRISQEKLEFTFQGEKVEMLKNIDSFQWNQIPNTSKFNSHYYGCISFDNTPTQEIQNIVFIIINQIMGNY